MAKGNTLELVSEFTITGGRLTRRSLKQTKDKEGKIIKETPSFWAYEAQDTFGEKKAFGSISIPLVLDRLGIDLQVGDIVTVSYQIHRKPEEFTPSVEGKNIF